MAVPKRNIVANLAGRGWMALTQLLFVPVYIQFLGIEAYGLVGIFSTLLAFTVMLDNGLGLTMSRELAWRSTRPDMGQEMRDLVRTLEVPYWAVTGAIGLLVVAIAPLLAEYWVNARTLSPATITLAVAGMGATLALQLPFGLYSGGLNGLERQVLVSGVLIAASTLRAGGAVLVLWLVSPTIDAFFAWHIVAAGVQTGATGLLLWRSLPAAPNRARFRRDLLRGVIGFAAGTGAILLVGTILGQVDKVVLSRVLPLETFGYYSLASFVAFSIFYISGPVGTAVFPRLAQNTGPDDAAALRAVYHEGCQLMALLLLPVSATLIFFAPEILQLWTGDAVLSRNTAPLVAILTAATTLSALLYPNFLSALAHDLTKVMVRVNIAFLVIFVPLTIGLALWLGGTGGALALLLTNIGFVFTAVLVVHRRILRGEGIPWLLGDLLRPVAAALGVVGIWRLIVPSAPADPLVTVAVLAAAVGSAFVVVLAILPAPRAWLLQHLNRLAFS